jgi:protein-S-isoprenylcysteine O-methyltransferase Ste14
MFGWALLLATTFMIDHFDLVGLRQSWLGARGVPYRPPPFSRRWLYAFVRHPLMCSFLMVFWVTPRMTVGHLLFAVASTSYILVGLVFEERDLVRTVPEYTPYRKEVGMLFPRAPRAS